MLRNFAIQAVIFFLVFQAISFLRETSMLATDTSLEDLATANNTQPASISNTANTDEVNLTAVPTLMGETISLKSQGKQTVLYFFAPWCQVCHASISNLQSLFEKNENIDVIAVAMDFTNKQEVVNFTSRHNLTFPIALGNQSIKQAFEISGYPSYYVINKDNVIIGKSMGYSSELGLYLRAL